MIRNKYIDLIDKEIARDITPAERAELHTYIFQNYEAQKLYQDLFDTTVLLSKVENVEPPYNLKLRIMKSLHVNQYAPQPKQKFMDSLKSICTFDQN